MKITSQLGIVPHIKMELNVNEDTLKIRKLPCDPTGKRIIYLVSVMRLSVSRGTYKKNDIAAYESEHEAKAVIKEINQAIEADKDYKPSGRSVWEGEDEELCPVFGNMGGLL